MGAVRSQGLTGFRPHLQHHTTPSATGRSDIGAARSIKHHFVGISAVHEVFEEGIDQDRQVGQ